MGQQQRHAPKCHDIGDVVAEKIKKRGVSQNVNEKIRHSVKGGRYGRGGAVCT